MLNNIDLNKLKIFEAVMRTGSYAKVSEELNITRSAVSQAITTLEGQLGFSLFLRQSKKMLPTTQALKLFDKVQPYQQAVAAALSDLQSHEQVEGEVRLGAYMEFTKTLMLPHLSKLLAENPNIKIRFTFDSPSRLQSMLETNKIDMSFSIFPAKVKGISSVKVYEEDLVLICNKSMLAQAKTLEGLLSLPMIDYYPSHSLLQRWIQKHYKRRIKKLPIQVYAATADVLLSFVSEGLGVGVVPSYLISDEVSAKVSIVRPAGPGLVDYIWLNQFKGQYVNSAHRHLSEYFSDIVL